MKVNATAHAVLGDGDFSLALAWRLSCGCPVTRMIRTYKCDALSYERAVAQLQDLFNGGEIEHTCGEPYDKVTECAPRTDYVSCWRGPT